MPLAETFWTRDRIDQWGQACYRMPARWNCVGISISLERKGKFIRQQKRRLAGIIYLEQADHNEIARMDICSSMIPIYSQFLFYADYEEEIRAVGHMQDIILRNIPIWKLKNLGDEDSVRLTRKTLLDYMKKM